MCIRDRITRDQILMFSLINNGYKEITKKTIKNTTPKLLFDPILISFWFINLIYIDLLGF